VRTLQQGFQRHLGMSPMAYVGVVRLRRAHQDLRSADPTHNTVGAIAQRWGFTHLCRFAAAHKTMYGETPRCELHTDHPNGKAPPTRIISQITRIDERSGERRR
jgi:transcriptional regulator GlxA family with amidase domain